MDLPAEHRTVRHWTIVALLAWTLLISASLVGTIYTGHQQVQQLATKEARVHFNKDLAIRVWATKHGGVYVPTNQRTPPNPNLKHIPERDLHTSTGKNLTLMNPAYMLRQMMDEYSELYGVKGHITSLKYLNPLNAPDEWETQALIAFEQGQEEVFEVAQIDDQPYLRLIRPMVTKEGCLKCHAFQGYDVGDIRGGVGVSVPMSPYLALRKRQNLLLFQTHSLIWLVGIVAIFYGAHRSHIRRREHRLAQEIVQERDKRLRLAIDSTNIGPWDWNIKTNEVYFSPEWKRHIGYEDHEIKGSYEEWESRLHAEDRQRTIESLQAYLDGKAEKYEVEFRLRHKDGSYRWIYTRGIILHDEEGKPQRLLGCHVDITEHKLREEEKENLIEELQRALAEVKTLQGILPICSFCKKIRNDKGYYEQIEKYIHKHSGVDFSHTICPTCMKEHYPEDEE